MKQATGQPLLQGFDCVARADARVLILGSMPGQESLRQTQYYAHPQNSFWYIMGRLFGADPDLPYDQRLLRLQDRGIVLWDVVHRCRRPGSLDAAIDRDSVETNDFKKLFIICPDIDHVFFNGQKAAALYKRLVLPALAIKQEILYQTLPSTSPAHASLNREQKYQQWSLIKNIKPRPP